MSTTPSISFSTALREPSPGEPDWMDGVRAALARAPEPERARELAASVLEAVPADSLNAVSGERARSLAEALYALCGVAPFFAATLRRRPELLLSLLDNDLSEPRSREALESDLDEELSANEDARPGDEDAAAVVLRRFKYAELARLTLRDCTERWVPLEKSEITLTEISQLADVLLDRALSIASQRVADRMGPPRWSTEDGVEVELGFCVLGLGKLGSAELNYSSDVDLVYIYETPPENLRQDGPGRPPPDYFTRLAQEFGTLVSASGVEGFLYRVDLELRPEGTRGTLVVTDAALSRYYELWADTWEKAAFMKARPVAGDAQLGWRAIRDVAPMLYQTSMDFGSVKSIRALKDKVVEARGGTEAAFDVKIDQGGIRDIEFIAQAMMLLHGGRIPQVRSRSTQGALRNLVAVDLLPEADGSALLNAYLFLRRVENRLQMEAERQVHRVVWEETPLRRLARAMGAPGTDAVEHFRERLESQRRTVRETFEALFGERDEDRIVEIFMRAGPQLFTLPAVRGMLEDLAKLFAREIDSQPDPERALNNLDRFIQGVGSRRFYYELLIDRPELVPRLAALFSASKYLSGYFASHPRLIEPVFSNPERLLLTPDELQEDMETIREESLGEDDDPTESGLAALRLFHHRQVLNVGLLDIAEKVSRKEVETALTDIAERCLDEALAQAHRQLEGRPNLAFDAASSGRFLIVGMGKLASRELGYGSDLDLIFLYDLGHEGSEDPDAQYFYVRLTQRLVSILQTPTAEGCCYEIDARLRPSGNQGTLVTSLAAFNRYHEANAQIWERQALLRARPVAGSDELRASFEECRMQALARQLPESAAVEIHRIRQRMETELAREVGGLRNFKTGRGGVLDVESVVQLLLLRHGREHPELFEVARLETHLERIGALGLLEDGQVSALRDGWDYLQRLGARLRIVENRSISDLDEERGDLDSLALRMGYASSGRDASARRALLGDYRRHTEAIRTVYETVFADAS